MKAKEIVESLGLLPHPEGGFYKEVYRSEKRIEAACLPEFGGERNCCTSIYYLLEKGDFSAFHRIKSDETWHFYYGGSLIIHILKDAGHSTYRLGKQVANGEHFQLTIPANTWFAAEPSGDTEFVLAGCTVSPGFDFRDFELAHTEKLSKIFPGCGNLIRRLCR